MKTSKIVGIIAMVAGLVMVVAGAVTWGVVTSQLKDEKIVVAGDADPVMGMKVAGKKVQGPITAFGQAEIIKKHANASGKTYAEWGDEQGKIKAEAKKLGVEDLMSTDEAVVAQIKASPELTKLKGDLAAATQARTTQMNGAFLRTSLFSSVITYGVAALVVGLGITHALFGYAFFQMGRKPEVDVVVKETVSA